MIGDKNIIGSDNNGKLSANGQCQNTLYFLRLLQSDYQRTRRQLEKISLQLAERETLVNQHLQHTYLTSLGYPVLRLSGQTADPATGCLGSIVLGAITQPAEVPQFSGIEVRCLGRFEVSSSSGRIERWAGAKARSVFQYLLARPHEPIVKDALMDALWPDCTPQSAANNLKAAVHSLRSTLCQVFAGTDCPQPVLFRQGSYLINPELSLWIDVEAFEKAWAAGRRLEKEHKIADAMREYEKAESLYRGDYLEDEPYGDWTLLRRETLKDIYLIILGKLADYSISISDYESCIHYSQKILAKDFCREDSYRRLMYCFARLGQRNRALHWFDICCKTIRAELNTEPDNETIELYKRLFADDILSLHFEVNTPGYIGIL
jgi:DNA-binding SARP family transcriptional activator